MALLWLSASGSVIDWVMKTQGVSFRHAVELLRDDNASLATAAVMLPDAPHSHTTRAGLGVKHSTVPKLGSPIDPKVDDRELLRQVIDYDRETLKESPEALVSAEYCEVGFTKRREKPVSEPEERQISNEVY